jgi:hypothetical protein
MVDATVVEKPTRSAVTKRTFKKADGTYSSRASTESTGFKIEFLKSGNSIEQELGDFSTEVLNAAALFGLVTSITNAMGGETDPDEQFNTASDRLQTLLDGEWAAERQTGPRTSDLLEGFVAYRQKNGVETDQARRDEFLAMIKQEGFNAKKYLDERPKLAAEVAAIKAARAAEKAKSLAGKARDAEADEDLLA